MQITMKNSIARGLGLKLVPTSPSAIVTNTNTIHPLDTPEGQSLSQSRIVLTWREQSSYEEALALYPFVKKVLLPDIAFQQGT